MVDRLFIEKKINEKTIPKIDETNFLGLGKPTDRIVLFLFAMALGVKKGERTPLKTHAGFILENSIKAFPGAYSYIFSILVDELRKENNEDKIDDKSLAFHVAEEYANTGFLIIEKLVSSCNDDNEKITELKYNLILEMDEKFEEIEASLNDV